MARPMVLALAALGTVSAASPLKPVARWPLPAVGGALLNKTDHLLLSRSGELLYVSAKSLDTLFVLNTTTGAVVNSISVLAPQGLGLTTTRDRELLWVGSDGDGVLSAFDTKTLRQVHAVNFSTAPDAGEADDVVVDPLTQAVLVAVGDDGPGSPDPAAVATVDPVTGAVLASIATPGHIEGFALVPGGTDLAVANSPHATPNAVLLLARNTSTILATWPLPAGLGGNTPLVIDGRSGALVVGCRSPPTLLVLAALGGGAVLSTNSALVADNDDLFLDPSGSGLLLASGGGDPPATQGGVSACTLSRDGSTTFLGEVQPAGKNSVPDWHRRRLYTAVQSTGPGIGAFVQVYAW